MSARTNDASANGRGGNEIHRGVRSQRKTDFTACDLRGASSRRDSCPSVEGARKRCYPRGARVYKRILNTPKNGKTREGAISDGTLAMIKEWADLAQDPSPDGFVFPSENLTTPLSLDNLWELRDHVERLAVDYVRDGASKTEARHSALSGIRRARTNAGRMPATPEAPHGTSIVLYRVPLSMVAARVACSPRRHNSAARTARTQKRFPFAQIAPSQAYVARHRAAWPGPRSGIPAARV